MSLRRTLSDILSRHLEILTASLDRRLLTEEQADAMRRLDHLGLTTDEKTHAIEQAAMFAAAGLTDQQLRIFAKITASAAITNEDLHQLARHGTKMHVNPAVWRQP